MCLPTPDVSHWIHSDWISVIQAVIALAALIGALYLPIRQRNRDRAEQIMQMKSRRAILAAAVLSEVGPIYNAIGQTGVYLNNDVYKTDASMFTKLLENISIPRPALIGASVNDLWLFGPDLGTRIARVLTHVATLDYIINYCLEFAQNGRTRDSNLNKLVRTLGDATHDLISLRAALGKECGYDDPLDGHRTSAARP